MNSKFKKFNKILMMSVAILLCLVLLSTSVVSGIFARYVITKTAATTVTLKKFGLTLTVDSSVASATKTQVNGETISVTIDKLELSPGDDIADVVKFTIGGNANVAGVNLKIATTVSDYANYTVPKGIGGVTATNGTAYLPIGFKATVKTSSANAATSELYAPWQSPTAASTIQSGVVSKLRTAIGDSTTGTTTNIATKKICTNVGDASSISYIYFGFNWPNSHTISGLDTNVMGTYLAEKGVTVKVTYTVTLEQV